MKKLLTLVAVFLISSAFIIQDTYVAKSIFPVLVNPTTCRENQIFYNMTTHRVLVCTGVNTITEVGQSTGIATLNGLSGTIQTFATGTTGTNFAISSVGTTHTFNIPNASATNRGLLISADWTTFNNKQGALGFTPENLANKNAVSGYAGLTASTKLNLAHMQEVMGISDLSDYAAKSGTGATAIGATFTGLTTNDCLTWSGTNWVNSASCGGGAVTSVFTRTGAVVAATNDYTWAQINKATSSLADIATRSATDLNAGTVPTARLGSGTANSTTFLRGDQTWATPAGSGDMTLAGVQTVTGAKTFDPAKLIVGQVDVVAAVQGAFYQDTDDTKLYWAKDGSTWGEVFVAGLSLVNLTSNVSGILPLANGGTGAALVDPGADRILFWDDSAGAHTYLSLGNNLSISTTTLSTTIPYDLSAQIDAKPAVSLRVLHYVATRNIALFASGHQCFAVTAATAQTDFVIAIDGVSKGTLRFAAAGTTCTIVSGASDTISAGERVTITAPASQDATLADITFTLFATLP